MIKGAYMVWKRSIIEKRLGSTFSRNRDLDGRLLIRVGSRARDDDSEDTILHVRDNFLGLSSLLDKTQGEKERRRTVVSLGTAMVR